MPHNPKKKRGLNPKSNITHDSIEFYKLTNNIEFTNDITVLRDEIGITNIHDLYNNCIHGAEELDKDEEIIDYLLNKPSLQKKLDFILRKYNLSENWFDAVFFYLLHDENIIVNKKFKPDGMKIMTRGSNNFLYLELGRDATLEEIIEGWPIVQKAISSLPNYKKKRRGKVTSFLKKYLIHRMHKYGMTDPQIALEIEKRGYGSDISVGNVKTIRSRFKKDYK